MNRNIRLLFGALILTAILISGSALAQTGRPEGQWHHGPPGAAQKLAHLERALGLSDEQSRQLLEILQGAEAEREALHAQMMEQYQPDICALRLDTEAQIRTVLTAEQITAFEQLQEERERTGPRSGRRGARAPDCATESG